ncbi:MAG: hypothetical protein E7648_01680 [Ruminococcaceae bacterium]|nr:hypothetical protein [Oscillospiraceae bacterium]
MKTVFRLLLCFIISFSLIFSGCGSFKSLEERFLIDYSWITYKRPDYDTLKGRIEASIGFLESEWYDKKDNKEALYNDFRYIVDTYYYDLLTMSEVAFINYCHDITNEDLRIEYYEIVSESQIISTLLDELYAACAKSNHVDFLEEYFLGEGFLDSYKGDYSVPDGLIALYARENELLKAYGEEMADLYCEFDGKTFTYDDLISITDDRLYEQVRNTFCEKYNRVLGEIYVELVEVRNEIADICGYGSYAEYAYENSLAREYLPGQADKYIKGVKKFVTPVYLKYRRSAETAEYSISSMLPETVKETAGDIVDKMSKGLSKLFNEMSEKNLCSVNSSDTMYYGSYQTYLNDYDSPYIFVNGGGTGTDVLTTLHEFGHFASAYYNYGLTGSIDESEVASQALELLSSTYLDGIIEPSDAELIKTYELFYILSSVNECAAWTAFENLAYSDDDLTLEECNEYYEKVCYEFGLIDDEGYGDDPRAWVLISHLTENPYYSIGYSVSANVAVQLYEIECLEAGQGIKTYISFIKLASNDDFFGNLEKTKLDSPFADGGVEKFASTLDRELGKIIK